MLTVFLGFLIGILVAIILNSGGSSSLSKKFHYGDYYYDLENDHGIWMSPLEKSNYDYYHTESIDIDPYDDRPCLKGK